MNRRKDLFLKRICFAILALALFIACENPFIVSHKQERNNEGGTENIITIGENGNWFINGVDTGIKAQGENSGQGGTAVIIGTYKIGETLSVIKSGFTGYDDSFLYHWLADGAAIPGAVRQEYILRGTDVGKIISCVITHENAQGGIVAWGKKVPFTIDLQIRGNTDAGDTAALSGGGTGHLEDVFTLTYNLADTALNNKLEFRNIEQVLAPVTEAGSGNRQYTVKEYDAKNGVIKIIAVFTHYNTAKPDPIAFTAPDNVISVTYGDNGNLYTNKIKSTYMGTGAINYSSDDIEVATVNSDGVVTIHKAGGVIISAEKDADKDYAYAFQDYNLIINPKPVIITGLGAADKVYDYTTLANVTGTPIIYGKLPGEDVSVKWGIAAFANNIPGDNKTVTFNGWSLVGSDEGNYLLIAQPESVTAKILKLSGAAVSGPPIVDGTPTMVNIEIKGVTNAETNGQEIEYAISTSNSSVPQTGWKTSLIFNGLTANTSYHVFARTRENAIYLAGAAQVSAAIRTASTPLPLSMSNPVLVYNNHDNVVTPIVDVTGTYNDDDASITVMVSGFKFDSDANNVGLAVSGNGLIFHGHNAVGYAVGGTKTFTVTFTFDTVTVNASSVNIAITGISNIPAGYEFTGSVKNTSVAVIDGKTAARAIPLTRANIAAFNVFATAEETRDIALTLHYKLIEDIFENDLRTDLGGYYNNLFREQGNGYGYPYYSFNWTAIGNSSYPFTGSFDGQGHTINGIISSSSPRGLFGYVGLGGMVKNIGLVNCSFHDSSSNMIGVFSNIMLYIAGHELIIPGYPSFYIFSFYNSSLVCVAISTIEQVTINQYRNYAGGVVGYNKGTVQNCHITDSIVAGSIYIGGVVGENSGTVQNCYVTDSFVIGNNYIGGVVGENSGTVRNCVALKTCVMSDIDISFPSFSIHRVTGQNSSMLTNNYAQSVVIVPDVVSSCEVISIYGFVSGLTTVDGANIGTAQYNSESWWKAAGNWSTANGGFAWDYTNVWEWSAAEQLPVLRKVGGQ